MENTYNQNVEPSLATGPHRVEMDNWIDCAPFEQLLRMKIESVGDGKAVLSMPFLFEFSQGAGLLHGGALTSLADTAVALACKSVLSVGTRFATISLESTFLAPVRQGYVTARAEVVLSEKRKIDGKVVIVDRHDKEVMHFTAVFKIARGC